MNPEARRSHSSLQATAAGRDLDLGTLAGLDSFPASDPPPYWGSAAKEPLPAPDIDEESAGEEDRSPRARFEGRTALVTGAASGMGRASAVRLAREGAAVVVADIQDENGQSVVDEIRASGGTAVYQRLDVSDEGAWAEAVSRAEAEF